MNKIPFYLKALIRKYPKIVSGRKNFNKQHFRIQKSLNLIKEYFKKTNN